MTNEEIKQIDDDLDGYSTYSESDSEDDYRPSHQ